ncbi:hypothetical protein LZ32DRAFT_25184 [Colletotrichum eremochloae]|nr:hypothetical protein LZ32DRAFT_25184 [Colletotrichum eremochloae]
MPLRSIRSTSTLLLPHARRSMCLNPVASPSGPDTESTRRECCSQSSFAALVTSNKNKNDAQTKLTTIATTTAAAMLRSHRLLARGKGPLRTVLHPAQLNHYTEHCLTRCILESQVESALRKNACLLLVNRQTTHNGNPDQRERHWLPRSPTPNSPTCLPWVHYSPQYLGHHSQANL